MGAYGSVDIALLGLPYGLDFKVESFPAAADIASGRPVYQTPGSPVTVKPTYAAGDVFIGVAMFSQTANATTVGVYNKYDVVNVLTRGHIYVENSIAITTAPAAAYATAGGQFSSASGGNYNVGCMFRANQTTVSGLALIEVAGAKLVV
jgi:hypothetical protein